VITVDEIITNHTKIALSFGENFKPLIAFNQYIRYGYFPYYKEDKELYHTRLLGTLNTIIELDLPSMERIDYHSVLKIKKLFAILSSLVPFTPNISQLSHDIETTRISLLNYLQYLNKAEAIMLLSKESMGLKQMTKPDKVYLGNTNYAFALGGEQTNIGSVRESFFMNQVRVKHDVAFSEATDFVVSKKYNIEIGGKNKKKKQISNLENAFVVLDNIETGFGNKIPLWIFGLTY
jgi:predicted AAA+ superfamily ATPase